MLLTDLKSLKKEALHHAYCVEGAGREGLEVCAGAVREAFGLKRDNPDVVAMSYGTFGVDEAEEFRRWAAERPMGGSGAHKFFILAADAYTHEAQNALLKAFEEPPPCTHFFLLAPRAELLLPTLRSRLVVLSAQGGVAARSTSSLAADADAFLAGTPAARLARVEKLVKALKDEKATRGDARAFLAALIARTRGEGAFSRARAAMLRELSFAEGYSHDRSASFKLLLEHLAVVLPKI